MTTTPPPPALALGEERIPPSEAPALDTIIAIHRDVQEQADRKRTPVPRGQHPKQHGCLLGELTIEPALPASLRHGLFRERRTFPALVRFSNARQRHDDIPDVQGMAIKVLDVPGARLLEEEGDARTQDFVLINHPVFFTRDVADLIPLLLDFRRLMTGTLAARALTVFAGTASSDYRYRILRAMVRKRPTSPFRIQYWSTTPLRFGAGAVKLLARPDLAGIDALPPPPAFGRDKFRAGMMQHLLRREARFDLLVQAQTDPVAMPIEDASVTWDEQLSPFRRVATLRLPPQAFDTEERMRFGEHLSFTPWHGLAEHRPLGGINRARRELYEVIARRRRDLNGVASREPSLDEVRAVWPAAV